jgi:hypothetical protein
MSWWLDKVTGVTTQGDTCLPRYRDAMALLKLEIGRSLFEKMAISAQKMSYFWLGRDGISGMVTSEKLFYMLLYGLLTRKEPGVGAIPITISPSEIWQRISNEGGDLNNAQEMKSNLGSEIPRLEESHRMH